MIEEALKPRTALYLGEVDLTSANRHKQAVYQMDPPLAGHRFVVASAAVTLDHGPETYLFGADADGNVVDGGELEGSTIGVMDHEMAFANAGYKMIYNHQG